MNELSNRRAGHRRRCRCRRCRCRRCRRCCRQCRHRRQVVPVQVLSLKESSPTSFAATFRNERSNGDSTGVVF